MTGLVWAMADSEAERRYRDSSAERLGFDCAQFTDILADLVARFCDNATSERERRRFLDNVRLDDVLLARACARGHEDAWTEFITLYRQKLYAAAIGIARQDSLGRELADSLYADLFGTRTGPDGERVSKLDSYGGRGSLEGWLRTLVAQEFVNRYRTQRRTVEFDEQWDHPSENESSVLSQLDQQRLADATDKALSELSSEEQFLLSAYYLDERTLADISGMIGVHESTVSRRIDKTAAALRKQILKELCRSGMPRRTAEELLDVDVRDLPVNVRHHLTQKEQG